jgi:hypothetical protein
MELATVSGLLSERGEIEKAAEVFSTLRKRKENQRKDSEAKLLQKGAESP